MAGVDPDVSGLIVMKGFGGVGVGKAEVGMIGIFVGDGGGGNERTQERCRDGSGGG